MLGAFTTAIRLVDSTGNVVSGVNGVFFRRSELFSLNNVAIRSYWGPLFYTTNGTAIAYDIITRFYPSNDSLGSLVSFTINTESLEASGYRLADSQSDTITKPRIDLPNTTFDFRIVPIVTSNEVTVILVDSNYPRYPSFDSVVADGTHLMIDESIVTFHPVF